MLNKSFKIRFAGMLCLLVLSIQLMAQNSVVSPYSRIGFGELYSSELSHIQANGLSSTSWSYSNLNLTNPASYSYLRTASMNIGFNIQYNQLEDENTSTNIWSGGLNTIAIGFPLINTINELLEQSYSDWRYGSVIALQPYSGVGYDLRSVSMDPELGRVESEFSGSGGTQLAFLGQSIRYLNTSLGVNVGYLFGSLVQSRLVSFPQTGIHYRNNFKDDIKTSGLYWKVGAMHDIILTRSETDPYFDDRGKPLRFITLGAHGKPATGFNSNANSLYVAEHIAFNDPRPSDTLFFKENEKLSGKLPPEIGFGASYNVKDKWSLGFDVALGLWSQYENEAKPEDLKNSYKVSIGGNFTPNHNSIHSFLERVTYRAGLYYFQDPRTAGGEQLEEYGIRMGMSMPFVVQRNSSSLHSSFQLGRRGISEGLKETFFNISIGFTVNDNSWFLKRRFD